MSNEIIILLITAIYIGFFHTLFGPDHYLPFIVMSKSGEWSMKKTLIVTFFCGLGHVLSSVVLGLIGVALGVAVTKLEVFEGFRGNIAAWGLLIFGFLYFAWGLKRAYKNKPHRHLHFHSDGTEHAHDHKHFEEHSHVHSDKDRKMTPWILFLIFVLGPCEPLIPILMYPAARNSYFGLIAVTLAFCIVTITTMMCIVVIGTFSLKNLKLKNLERYTHAMAGLAIFLCGAAIQFLGL